MSDTRLRELERRWKETGSPDDEAAYLLERVRVGDLTQERLELAAYCGHEGAVRATPPGNSSPTQALLGSDPAAVMAWGMAFERWGRTACVVGALSCARYAVSFADGVARPVAALIDSVAAWLHLPDEAHSERVRRATDAAWPTSIDHVALVACWTAECVTGKVPHASLGQALEYAVALTERVRGTRDAGRVAAEVQDAVSRWALGPDLARASLASASPAPPT